MRRFAPVPRRASSVRLFSGIIIAVGIALTTISAQIPGRNVNMVSGTGWPDGDPFLQRQNEPSIAGSTRNPLHLLGGSNDYRTVDVPGLPDGKETGDAWLGLFKSLDGGQRWTSTLLPGFPQDDSLAGNSSPLKPYSAGADAVVRAGTHGLIYYSGLVFDRDDDGKSAVFLSRFIDNNNIEAGDPFAYLGTTLVAKAPAGSTFLDKPWLAVDIPRGNPTMCTVSDNDLIPTGKNGKLRKYQTTVSTKAVKGKKGKAKGPKKGGASNPQQIPAGAIYVAYTAFTGEGLGRTAQIYISRSVDCGKTWGEPIRASRAEDQLNQGSNIAIDPRNGNVYVAWRRFDPDNNDANDLDAMMVARIPFNGKKADAPVRVKQFPKTKKTGKLDPLKITEHREDEGLQKVPGVKPTEVLGELEQFDLTDSDSYSFRSLAYPTMTIDATGRVYIAWTQRGFTADSLPANGVPVGARIVITTSLDGKVFTPVRAVDDHTTPGRGHQLMPSMTFAGGKLMLIFYDMRETRAVTSNTSAAVHNSRASDIDKIIRHTIDIRSAMASPGDAPQFEKSVKVSDYLMGINPRNHENEQLQVNPPNLPMFRKGTAPFMGDYIDVTATPAFVPLANGKWAYNVGADTGVAPVFHAVWTDNRDVRPPSSKDAFGNPDWTQYTPAQITHNGDPNRKSLFDGGPVVECSANATNAGSRNQNIYSSRITTKGLLAASPGNAKPLSMELQRGFVVFAQNTTATTKSYRMSIASQPPGGRASFAQFPLPPYTATSPAPDTAIELIVPARTTAARTVYVTSSNPDAQINVDVVELVDLRAMAPSTYPTAARLTDGASTRVLINPDIENPDIENPDIENPDIENPDIENAEVYNPDIENPDIENPDIENPDIENPDIENPDIENPDIENPDIENPDIENVRVANPDIENITITNPDIENPDIENPDIENPDIENPDIENGAVADIAWQVTNTGNTTASFNVNLFLANQNLPIGVHTQLVLLKTYRTPVTVPNGCQLGFQTRNVVLANIPRPVIVAPNGEVSDPNDPAPTNATLWLAPGEEGRIVLRVVDDTPLVDSVLLPKIDADGNPVLDENGQQKFVRLPAGVTPSEDITPVVQQQSVNSTEAEGGVTEPPILPPPPGTVSDHASTAEVTPVTFNVLANDTAAFGSTKIVSFHAPGMASHSGGGPGDITYQPSTGFVYSQRGAIAPSINALVGRFPPPPSGIGVAYQQANVRSGINYQRSSAPNNANATLSALDARPDSPTFHQYLTMPPLLESVLSFAIDSVHHRLYVVHGAQVATPSTNSWFSAIDIDPAHVGTAQSPGPFHTALYTIPMPVGMRGNAVAVNTRTQKVYVAMGGVTNSPAQTGVFVVDGASAAPTAARIANTSNSFGVVVNEASNQIFAGSAYSLQGGPSMFQLHAIDGATLAVAAIQTPQLIRFGNADERLVVHEATVKVFARLGNAVVVFDGKKGSPSRNTVLAVIPVGADAGISDIGIDQQLGRVITTGGFDFRADVIDAATHTYFGTVPLANAGLDIAIDPLHHVAYVAVQLTSIVKVDLTGLQPSVTIPVFIEAGGPLLNPTNHRAYVPGVAEDTGVAILNADGLVGKVAVNNDAGRFNFGVRHESTNRYFIPNSANQAGTSLAPGSVIAIDGASNTVSKYLDTLPNPFGAGIDQQANRLYIASSSGDSAHGGMRTFDLTNLDTPGVDAQFNAVFLNPTGTDFPLNGQGGLIGFQRWVVVNPTDHRAYVLVAGGSQTSVAVYDPANNRLSPLDGRAGTVLFDHQASAGQTWGRANIIRVDSSRNRIILGFDNGTTNRVVVLDGGDLHVVYNAVLGRHSNRHTASYIVLDEAVDRMFVSNYSTGVITMLNASTDAYAPIATVTVAGGPSAQELNLTDHRLYVSSIDTKTLSRIEYSATTMNLTASAKLPLVAYFLAVDDVEDRIYTGGGDSADESGVMVVPDAFGQFGTPVSVTGVSQPSHGVATLNTADYSVTYKPNPGFSGADSFTYNISAPTGTNSGTVTINVVPSVPTPIALSDAYAATLNQPLSISAPGPLANDAVGSGLVTMVMDALPLPAQGQLTPQPNGSFVFVPATNFSGTASFVYHAVGPLGSSNQAQVTITVAAQANAIEVTNTNDSGAGSLRNAITIANVEPNSVIRFAITSGNQSPGGAYMIQPATALPAIVLPVVIDGYTQSGASPNTLTNDLPCQPSCGSNAVIKVMLRGNLTGGNGVNGLTLQGGASTIRGLSIGQFNGTGILLDTLGGNTIEGNFIGVDADGITPMPNGTPQTGTPPNTQGPSGAGITSRSPANFIGSASPAARNLISGNFSSGIRVERIGALGSSSGAGAQIVNNLIGTDRTGTTAVPNGPSNTNSGSGINVSVENVTIGGLTRAARNVISGNNGTGINSFAVTTANPQQGQPPLTLSSAADLTVIGNYIGIKADGSAILGNTGGGVFASGAHTWIGGSTNTTPGGVCSGACNVISGNGSNGVTLGNSTTSGNSVSTSAATGSFVEGNYIGVNPSGTARMPNNFTGVRVAAAGVRVGGASAAQRNIVSGNNGTGISVDATTFNNGTLANMGEDAIITGNYVGVDVTGKLEIGNQNGISVSVPRVRVGGTNIGERNIISGNISLGVSSGASLTGTAGNFSAYARPIDMKVLGNYIGVDVDGTSAIPNGRVNGQSSSGGGVVINGANSFVGGTDPGAGNVISGNVNFGVSISVHYENPFVIPPQPNQVGTIYSAGDDAQILGNMIGTNAAGTAAIPNGSGISVFAPGAKIGNSTPAGRNIIAANTRDGISLGTPFVNGTGARVNTSGAGAVIRDNYIGVGADGGALGNGGVTNGASGIAVAVPNVTIGGPFVADRNVISANINTGINSFAGRTFNSNTTLDVPDNLQIEGNYIGTDPTGVFARGNGSGGVLVSGANSLVKGNVIAGNTNGNGSPAVNVTVNYENQNQAIYGTIYSTPSGTKVFGNMIGLNANGAALPNEAGINVTSPGVAIGGIGNGERNFVSANNRSGIYVGSASVNATGAFVAASTGTVVRNNFVGLDAGGINRMANLQGGITVASPGVMIGGVTAAEGNYVVGAGFSAAINLVNQTAFVNNGTVLVNNGGSATVQNNVIGLGTNGLPLNSSATGIQVQTASNQIVGNTIGGNTNGINFSGVAAASNGIRGNYIGTTATGALGLGNSGYGISINDGSNNTIGGSSASDRNVIVANSQGGIFVNAQSAVTVSGTTIVGNYVGVLPNGTTPLSNGNSSNPQNTTQGIMLNAFVNGVVTGTVVGGSSLPEANLVGGNIGNGIGLYGPGVKLTSIRGNFVGVGTDGTTDLRNTMAGVWISAGANDNTVGGPLAADGNTIAFNPQVGIGINFSSVRNRILSNRIYSNGGLGIDLGGNNAIESNDAGDTDTGDNDRQNFPVLTSVDNSGPTTKVNVDASSFKPGNYTVQIFANAFCDGTNGEGGRFVGTGTITQPGGQIILGEVIPGNEVLTGTATDNNGNTSEFSACLSASNPPTMVTNLNDSGPGSLRASILYTNGHPGWDVITFNVPGVGAGSPGTINLVTPLPVITEEVGVSGNTQPGYTNSPLIELNGAALSPGANGLVIQGFGTFVTALAINRFPQHGVVVQADSFWLRSSYVGLAPDGISAAGNGLDGVVVTSGQNIIGIASGSLRNVISGNGRDGVVIASPGNFGTSLWNNHIGTNAAGTAAVPNARHGVYISQSTNAVLTNNNVISGNAQNGVMVNGCDAATRTCNGHTITSNRIGTTANGLAALPNGQHGISIDNAPNNTIRFNVVSGNTLDGVYIHGISGASHGNQLVAGNMIGTTASGNAQLGNQRDGIALEGPSNGSRIGGPTAQDRNVISWNGRLGVHLATQNVSFEGNYVGVPASGNGVAGNGDSGVLLDSNASNVTVGGASANLGNVISNNGNGGVVLWAAVHDNIIRNNIIGLDAGGSVVLGNTGNGVGLDASNNVIQENRISHSTVAGVRVFNGTGNKLIANRITNNTTAGIDLGNAGPNANDAGDADTGPNNLQNYPVLTGVSSIGNDTIVVGTLNSTPNSSFTMAFFQNAMAGPYGFGEGAQYLAMLPATTDNNGDFSFSATMQNVVTTPNQCVSVTATNDNTGDTSEFSTCVLVTSGSTVVLNTNDAGAGSLRAAITNSNSTPGTQTITFNIPNVNPGAPAQIFAGGTGLPVITAPVVIDATTQPGYDGKPVVELIGSGNTPNGFETGFDVSGVTIKGFAILGFNNAGIYFLQADGGQTTGNHASFNYLGTNRNHVSGQGNQIGMVVRTDYSTVTGNVISGNGVGGGMRIENDADNVLVSGNKIGTTDNGLNALQNSGHGIVMLDSLDNAVIENNVISGNYGAGINIQDSVAGDVTNTRIRSNIIGLSANGNLLGNAAGGVRVDKAPGTFIGEPGARNVISGNVDVGIRITGDPSPGIPPRIYNNYIGLDPTGQLARPNTNFGISIDGPAIVGGTGGPTGPEFNYISGNGNGSFGAGILVGPTGGGSTIIGNAIGTNVLGQAVGNTRNGITVGSTSAITIGSTAGTGANMISGNGEYGIRIGRIQPTDPPPANVVIEHNVIGTNYGGTVPIPNGLAGISVEDGVGHRIGGNSLAGNIIAFNVNEGIRVIGAATRVRIQENSIRSNGALGIDLNGDGHTPNGPQPGNGPNGLQSYPVIGSAANNAPTTQVTFDANVFNPGVQETIEFFSSATCHSSGFGQGHKFQGSTVVVGGQGNAVTFLLNEVVADGERITATATDPSGNTSEFSNCVTVGPGSTVVSNTNDSGSGSLRAALTAANNAPGTQTITFDIPGVNGANPALILLSTALPVISGPVIIDGTSQPGYDNKPVIEVNGQGVVSNGFQTATDVTGVTIRGFAITRFTNAGVFLLQTDSASGGNTVSNNYIGVNRAAAAGTGNVTGILTRGDFTFVAGNVIAGNIGPGVVIENDADSVTLQQNIIGLLDGGLTSRGNSNGVVIYGSVNDAMITDNIISANSGWGIDLQPSAGQVTGTVIRRNVIGLNQNVDDAGNGVGNPPGGGGGVRVVNAPGTVIGGPNSWRNVISGNGGPNPSDPGVGIQIMGNVVPMPVIQSNVIGLEPAVQDARSNNVAGIVLDGVAQVGGINANEGNYISGNGTLLDGGTGIRVTVNGGGSAILGNVIGLNQANDAVGNGRYGISVASTTGVTIGSSVGGGGNIVSGNGQYGIIIIKQTSGDPEPMNTVIENNLIGTEASGVAGRPNGHTGIYVFEGSGHRIGGNLPNAGNTIAFNGGAGNGNGVVVAADARARIQQNSIFSNHLLGIDLAASGVTVNDPGDTDTGANMQQNFVPMISAVTTGSQNTEVVFDTNPLVGGNQFTVEFFANNTCDASGHGEGYAFAGSRLVAGGGGNITFALGLSVAPGQFITATATDANGNTSEFSNCVQVSNTSPPTVTAVEPSTTFASGQMLTFYGSNFQAAGGGAVVIRSGSNDYPGTYLWYNNGSKLIVRTASNAPNGPATLIVKNGTAEATPIPITIQTQEAAPIFMHMRNGNCSGFGGPGDTTQSWSGGDLYLVASGIDTFGAEAVFVPVGGGPTSIVSAYAACGFPGGGDVAVQVQVPSLPAGNYKVTMRSNGLGHESLDSNAKTIQIINVFVNAVSGGAANTNCDASCGGPPGGPFPAFTVGTVKANQSVMFTASGVANYSPSGSVGPNGNGGGVGTCGPTCLAPNLPSLGLIGRINGGSWFFIGTGATIANQWGQGYLELAMNDTNFTDNSGGWTVTVNPQ